MLNPTQAHKQKVKGCPLEPTIRIGRQVPEGAVNMGYYYNPTASGSEKVLTSEAPRSIIDHRMEEDYKYLFNQASNDDSLFPGSVEFSDEEGYKGRLGRMYVNWYPNAHVDNKNVTKTKEYLGLLDKGDIPKIITWDNDDGYTGSLYVDSVDYEVADYKEVKTQIPLDYTVQNHEINYYSIYNQKGGSNYIDGSDLKAWLIEPYNTGSKWPKTITVTKDMLEATDGLASIQDYINKKENPYVDVNGPAVGTLTFSNIDYEPIAWKGSTPCQMIIDEKLISSVYSKVSDEDGEAITDIDDMFPESFQTYYDYDDDSYDAGEIENFIDNIAKSYSHGIDNTSLLNSYLKNGKYQVTVYRTYQKTETEEREKGEGEDKETYKVYKYWAKYKATVIVRGDDSKPKYNVVCNYSGTLKTTLTHTTNVPNRYNAKAEYKGLVRKVWNDYDGVAYYRGSVTKGNAIGNVNPEGDNELLMFPDDDGYLRTKDGSYNVESDLVYITDTFKDGVACFYRHRLKQDVYDYRGPDDNGFYEGNVINVVTGTLRDIPKDYKYAIKLNPSEYTEESYVTDDLKIAKKQVPMRYAGFLYSSFISGATDTFKCIYNGFNDSDKDNIGINNGITEDIYNYPFYTNDVDYKLYPIDEKARINKIQLIKPKIIDDTRRYISFSYTVTAEHVQRKKKFTTEVRVASILNKEYSVKSEEALFDGRGMIISPKVDGIYLSPFDLVLKDQANHKEMDPVITSKDTDFIFYATITSINDSLRGAVNLKCNPDGNGYLTAETTISTGFFDTSNGTYTKKLSVENEYVTENGKIYMGYKVRCIDARKITMKSPRETGLLESWQPMVQFGHYSQVMDQYGAHLEVFYTMPEYDSQHFSSTYKKPYVDIEKEQVEFLNSHAVRTQRYPLLVQFTDKNVLETIKLYKEIDDKVFPIEIENVSFEDGILFTKHAVSENDKLFCTYTYLEENYVYRGYWRDKADFCRIDLNPNTYHTYSDVTYTPSQIKPSKNLFNKVIYFFMRPRIAYEIVDKADIIVDKNLTPESLKDLFVHADRFSFLSDGGDNYHAKEGDEKAWVYDDEINSFKQPLNTDSFNGFLSTKKYINYQVTVKLMSSNADDDVNGIIAAYCIDDNGRVHMVNVLAQKGKDMGDWNIAVIYNHNADNEAVLFKHAWLDGSTKTGWENDYITVKVKKEGSKLYIYYSKWNSTDLEETYDLVDLDSYSWGAKLTGSVPYGYCNQSQANSYFQCLSFEGEIESEKQYQVKEVKFENTDTLYHKIDDSVPDSDTDLYIGSVYIKQNTSLHSTVLVDTRIRGGGVLKSMSDELRHQLEPESDWYLDIGYYDGKPYQENGVILVRLDNCILKEYGGKFTMEEVNQRVQRWLGYGIYPIIEYVETYSKYDLPQYTLEVEDSYTNVVNEVLEIYPEVEE